MKIDTKVIFVKIQLLIKKWNTGKSLTEEKFFSELIALNEQFATSVNGEQEDREEIVPEEEE